MTVAQKAAKKKRQKEYMTIFVHGKQKRVKRPPTRWYPRGLIHSAKC